MKKLFYLAVVAIMLVGMNSCQYENPALEESENPIVEELEMANMMLGKGKLAADEALKDEGYAYVTEADGQYLYSRTDEDGAVVISIVFTLGSKNTVNAVVGMFEPQASGSYLGDFSTMKEFVTTLGSEVKISTKETCPFAMFLNSNGDGGKMDYTTMMGRIDSSTNGFGCYWIKGVDSMTDEELVQKVMNMDVTCIYFDCDDSDYMSMTAQFGIMSEKYK